MTELILMEENDGQQQEQDVAEREERLREILKVLWHGAGYEDTRWDTDDIDFIAACCGISDYRKPKT